MGMRVMRRGCRGQSTMEYAVLAAVIVGAMLAMQIYVKRGAMGKLREASDQLGKQFTPLQTTSSFTSTKNAVRNDVLNPTGLNTSTIQGTDSQNRTGTETVQTSLDSESLF